MESKRNYIEFYNIVVLVLIICKVDTYKVREINKKG